MAAPAPAPSAADADATPRRRPVNFNFSPNPIVASRQLEDLFFMGALDNKPSVDTIREVIVGLDNDGDVLIVFETFTVPMIAIIILDSSDGSLGWRECRLLRECLRLFSRGEEMSVEKMDSVARALSGKFGAVELGWSGPENAKRLALKIRPGSGTSEPGAECIKHTMLRVDASDQHIDLIMIVDPDHTFVFNLDLLSSSMKLGIAECKCLALCFSYSETGDPMNQERFFAYCALLQEAYNDIRASNLREEERKELWVCLMHPTMLRRDKPIEPRFSAALDAVRSKGTANAPTSLRGTSEYPGVEKGPQIAESDLAVVHKGKYGEVDAAVKVFRSRHTSVNPEAVAAFKEEIRGLRKISPHRNVVEVLDLFETPKLCVVMKFVYGGTLAKFIEVRKREHFEPMEAMRIVRGCVDAVHHLHSNGFIHRDVKSTNFLFSGKNPVLVDLGMGKQAVNVLLPAGDGAAKSSRDLPTFVDLGMGRKFEPVKLPPPQEKLDSLAANVLWMAPEMFQRKECSDKSDIYALAIVMWEILACAKPFEGDEFALGPLLSGALRPNLALVGKLVPTWFLILLKQCWAGEPYDRPSTSRIIEAMQRGESAVLNPRFLFVAAKGSNSEGLELDEFCELLQKLQAKMSSLEQAKLFELIDRDQNGIVSEKEFMHWWNIVERSGLDAALGMMKTSDSTSWSLEELGKQQRRRSFRETPNVPMPSTTEDVGQWLLLSGLAGLVSDFEREKIDGDALKELNTMSENEIRDFLNIKDGELASKLKKRLTEFFA